MILEALKTAAGRKAAFLAVPALVAVGGLLAIGANGERPSDAAQTATAQTAKAQTAAGSGMIVTSANAAEPAKAGDAKSAASFSESQRGEIEKIVRDYLVKNPKILREMTAALQGIEQRERDARNAKLVMTNRDNLFKSDLDFVYGNPDGNIGVVEYFDYNCAWCKRALTEVVKLADADKNVRVIMKEFPIFGPDSQFAAKAAMAAKRQGKYWELHTALMKQRRVTKASTMKAANDVGLDLAQLEKDMQDPAIEASLAETARVAQALNIEGTPAFIVDDRVNVGFVPAAALKNMIDAARKRGCQVSC